MGFLFNPDPSSEKFDGVSITATFVDPPTFTAKDVWVTRRPWVQGDSYWFYSDLLPQDSVNNWTISTE